MALICDYCGQAIVTPGATMLTDLTNTGVVRVDLHPECVNPYNNESKKIKGPRPKVEKE